MSEHDTLGGAGPAPIGRGVHPAVSTLVGLLTALLGALVWGGVVAATKYQLGIIAVGIGMAVGYVMARTARPLPALAPVGALLAVIGCVAGDLFSDVIFQARFEQVPLGEALQLTASHPTLARQIFTDHFAALDVVFWAIAAWAAFRPLRHVVRVAAARAATVSESSADAAPGLSG